MIHRVAIEHFPFDQAKKIVNDIEAFLIFTIKPFFNSQYKDKEKKYIKPFKIVMTKNIDIKQIETSAQQSGAICLARYFHDSLPVKSGNL
ncbi:MAG: hypothetical protein Q7J06_03510 [Bacteroidales bacterium]|nr:hypothetical protein [Bacteroidales bacterium]